MVLVLEGGDVRQQMLTLAEPVEQDALSDAAGRINTVCDDRRAEQIRREAVRQPTLEQEIMTLVADLMDQTDRQMQVVHYDGLINILDPAHLMERMDVTDPQQREDMTRSLAEVDGTGARQTLHLLEEQSLLEEILSEALAPGVQGVQVMIAGEGRWEELSHTSMVLARYGVQGQATGALGVLGPTRLHYGRAISAVRYVSGLMTDMLFELYGGEGGG
jgi:heat-inducible transcriptional repressor